MRACIYGAFAIFLILAAPVLFSTYQASAMVVPIDKAYSYETHWSMPSKIKVEGLVQPRILIESYNNSIITGSIVDESGDRLTFYGKESKVMIRWQYDSGFRSKWFIGATPVNGTFAIPVPNGYEYADSCRLYINGNDYLIGTGTNTHNVYNYSNTNIWVLENYFKIKAPYANPDDDWYVYDVQIPVKVNSAVLTYRLS